MASDVSNPIGMYSEDYLFDNIIFSLSNIVLLHL